MISIDVFIDTGMPVSSRIIGETPELEGSSQLILREDTPQGILETGMHLL